MGRIIQRKTTRVRVRKSKYKPKHCPVCGAFMGKKGKKKNV